MRFAVRSRPAEDLQRLVFRRGREGEKADVGLMAALGHGLEDFFLVVGQPFFLGLSPGLFLDGRAGKHALELRRRLAALGAVRLIDDDRIPALGQVADLFRHKGELLERGDNDRHARNRGPRPAGSS